MPREMIKITRAANVAKRTKKDEYSCRFRVPVAPNSLETYWSPWFKFTAHNASEKESAVIRLRQELEDEINGKTLAKDATFGEYARQFHEFRKETGEINELSWGREDLVIKQIEKSSLAHISVKNMISSDIEACIVELRRDKNFTENMVYKFYCKVKQILKDAVKHRVIPYSPCDAINFKNKAKSKERRCLPDDVLFNLYLELSADPKDGRIVAIRIVVETGFRRGEALGLIKEDLDFEDDLIHLRRQLNSSFKTELPKYESIRDVPMSFALKEYLYKWLQFIADKFFDGNIESIPNDFPICCNSKGGYLRTNNFDRFRRDFFTSIGLGTQDYIEDVRSDGRDIVRHVNYQGYDLHELRHTAITNMLTTGGDLRAIMDIAGHQKLSTTQGYIHTKDERKQKTMKGYSDFLSSQTEEGGK